MRTDSKFLKIILILSALGIIVAAWLLSLHLKFSTGQALLTESCSIIPLGGTDSQGCAKIAVSDYSFVFGIPLASIALGFYLALFGLVLWAWRNPQTSYEPLYVGFNLSTLAIPVTALMAFISRVKLQSFCMGCAMLWLINLLLWPSFVKQLGLSWGNALSANGETFFPKKLSLLRSRILSCLTYAAAAVLIVALTGFLAEKMQQQNSMYGGVDRALKDYREAKQMFLPPEAYTGPQTKGSPSGQAVMQIVEFSDLECPACRLAAQYFKPFLLKHSKDVSFSYRHFPLDGACNPYSPNGMHANACNAAKAAICAGEQGKFYAFHDAAFDNQENFSTALFKQFANDLQLDKSAWEACLEAPSTRARLEQDMQWGNQIGLQSTPTIMINGRKLSGGAIHPAQLEVLLEALKNGTADAPKHGESH